MNPAQLLEHFDRISEAPDAVARLRRFILDLAVRGKLVEQDSNDEPASELFKRIQAERASDVAGTRKQAVITKVGDSDVPFPAPLGWLWLRFGLAHDLVRGVTYTKSDVAETQLADYLPILRANNIGDSLNFDDLVFVRQECIGPDQMLRRGDYLIALSSGSKNLVGKAAFVDADHPCGFGGFCGVIRLISPLLEQFVGVFLSSRLYRDAISAGSRGIGINNLKRETLNEALFPLPPLAEQQRIVTKVNELMALCDQLEAAKNEREARRDQLVAASLHHIGTAPTATGEAATEIQSANLLRDAARFHLDHLPRLTTRPEHIKQLRQTILNLAVRGRLVPQDPSDEPIVVALQTVLERRAELVRTKKIRQKKLDSCAALIRQGDLPTSWVVERLGNLVDPENTISYGVLVPGNEVADGVPFVRAQDLALNSHPKRPNKSIAPEIEKAYARTRLKGGEILLCVVGSIGKLGVVPPSWAGANIARAVARISPVREVLRDYLLVILQAQPLQSYFAEATRTLAQPTLNVGLIEQAPIPLPPLAEQHRIVAKVNELMALCDQLEAQLAATQTDSRRLLEAMLHEALAAAA